MKKKVVICAGIGPVTSCGWQRAATISEVGRMNQRKLSLTLLVILFVAFCAPENLLQASSIYPLEIFTSNGGYYNSPDVNMYVVVSNGSGVVDFTFYNESLIDSSLAGIYFDDGSLLGISNITNGPGTSFNRPATPNDLPSGNLLEPPFVTTDQFCVDGDPPVSHNGVNPVESGEPLEWVKVTFTLINDGTLSAVIDELNTGVLRIGAHVIALPDGSSESAVNVPEPATVFLLCLGGLVLIRMRK
ncbi:MAG: PEP-CTERM sorting domain-containing protein [Planctomycetota bacterium]